MLIQLNLKIKLNKIIKKIMENILNFFIPACCLTKPLIKLYINSAIFCTGFGIIFAASVPLLLLNIKTNSLNLDTLLHLLY